MNDASEQNKDTRENEFAESTLEDDLRLGSEALDFDETEMPDMESQDNQNLVEEEIVDPYEPEEDSQYIANTAQYDNTDVLTEGPETDKAVAREGEDSLTEILEYIKLFLVVFLIALFITQYILQRNTVKGLSMYPTLNDGDELFVEKVSRYFGDINRFDIITVDTKGIEHDETNRVIKRVIGLPGDTVEIKDGQVYINGELLQEKYLPEEVMTVSRNPQFDKVTLAENEYYCLGDNRNNSNDSRSFGPIPADHILGKLLVRFYPFDRIGKP